MHGVIWCLLPKYAIAKRRRMTVIETLAYRIVHGRIIIKRIFNVEFEGVNTFHVLG
jgi:hypothetical protein